MIAPDIIHDGAEFSVEVYQDVPAWAQARGRGIGGSDAAAVWGVCPWSSPFSLWCDKVHGVRDMQSEEWLEIGHELEVPIARLYSKRTGHRAVNAGKNVLIRSKKWDWMTYSLDFAIYEGAANENPGILETKNRGAYALREWEDGGVPLHVQLQVLHGMAVLGWKWGRVAALIGGNTFRWFPVERDEEMIELHVQKCASFWCNHVLTASAPETDGHEATKSALGGLYSGESGEEVQLGADAVPWALSYQESSEAEKAAAGRKLEASNWLKARIGSASIGRLPDGSGFSLRTIEAATVPAHERKAYRQFRQVKARR